LALTPQLGWQAYHWILERGRFRYTRSEEGQKVGNTVVVLLSNWLYGLVAGGNHVLTYDPDYHVGA
jgi:hypothetical protein